jgi:hypothetical protein
MGDLTPAELEALAKEAASSTVPDEPVEVPVTVVEPQAEPEPEAEAPAEEPVAPTSESEEVAAE